MVRLTRIDAVAPRQPERVQRVLSRLVGLTEPVERRFGSGRVDLGLAHGREVRLPLLLGFPELLAGRPVRGQRCVSFLLQRHDLSESTGSGKANCDLIAPDLRAHTLAQA